MYMDANELLYEDQSGFRLLISVATALLSSTNDWYLNMDKGKVTGLMFIDLRKALDKIELRKLKLGQADICPLECVSIYTPLSKIWTQVNIRPKWENDFGAKYKALPIRSSQFADDVAVTTGLEIA